MTQALAQFEALLIGLLHLLVTVVAGFDGLVRGFLAGVGVRGEGQNAVLVVLAIFFLLGALQVFGRVVTLLLAVFLAILMLRALGFDLGVPGR